MSKWKYAKKELPIEDGTYLVNVKDSFKEWVAISKYTDDIWEANTITRNRDYSHRVILWCEIEDLPEKEDLFVLTEEHKEIFIKWLDNSILDLDKVIDKHRDHVFTTLVTRVTNVQIRAFKHIKSLLKEL